MPSSQTSDRRQTLQRLTNQYHRRERAASLSVAIAVGALFLATYLATALLPAIAVAAVLVVAVRTPVFQSRGTIRLQTDKEPEAVLEQFTDSQPPILAFQWGVADNVRTSEHGATYSFSYLLGLRSTEMEVHSHTETNSEGTYRVELAITVSDRPWGTYTATISRTDTGSTVDVEYTSDRRFGLRRIPQQVLGERFHDRMLAAQGFNVDERERHVSIAVVNNNERG